ncbi:hypothetical protein [Streptomyces boncukensis]|nr:hypothetical protein [Streptomyces boncukensis]
MVPTRRHLLGSAGAAALTALGSAAATGTATAAARDRGAAASALWREFAAAPYTHPQIPYVGRAGARSAPPAHGRRVLVRRPARGRDAAGALNRALREVGEAGGGTVQLEPGTYHVGDVIRIAHDRVTLRGAGSGRTTLHPTAHLTDLIGPYGSRYGGDKSAWSWAGGLVWVCPRARWDSLVAAIRTREWPFEGWTGNARDEWRTLTALDDAPRGAWTVRAADPGALRPGQLVLLQLSDDGEHTLLRHMAGDVPGAARYSWAEREKLVSYVPYEWPVRVRAVRGRAVALERPLPLDLRAAWQPRLTTLVRPVTRSGVEGLTVGFDRTEQSPHLHDQGRNGVVFQCAYDCRADDVRVVNADNGFGLVAASACTLRRTRVSGRGSHHPYFCREGSHDNLVERFRIDRRTVPAPPGSQLHGINVEGLSSHNVWSRGRMDMGTFDTHRGMPFANVRTQITVHNDGRHGGDASAGPLYGARFAHWNVTVANARAGCVRLDGIAPYSATVGISRVREWGQIDEPDFDGELHTRLEGYGCPDGVRPWNLYEAQRAL